MFLLKLDGYEDQRLALPTDRDGSVSAKLVHRAPERIPPPRRETRPRRPSEPDIVDPYAK